MANPVANTTAESQTPAIAANSTLGSRGIERGPPANPEGLIADLDGKFGDLYGFASMPAILTAPRPWLPRRLCNVTR
jgi:hypothetical protein